MKMRYDPEVDVLSILFRETTVTRKKLTEGITAEYDQQGRLVGLEILDAARQLGDPSVFKQIILEGLAPANTSNTI